MLRWMRTHIRGLLLLMLIASVGLNAMLVLRYRVPGRLFEILDEMGEDLPDIPTNLALPPPEPPKLTFATASESAGGFAEWREAAGARIRDSLGVRIATGTPEVRVVAREDLGSVTRETLVLTQADGFETPAFLFVPEATAPRPALVVLPAYSRGIVGTAGLYEDYQNAMALRLAEAGYVTITTEIRGLGYLSRVGEGENDMGIGSYTAYSITFGRSLPGVMVSDAMRSVDYLASRAEVDPDSVGAVGFSLGGKAAIYLGAVDPRIKAVVASGCVMSFEANFQFAQHGPEDAVPGLGTWLTFGDCIGAIAPRPTLVHWGENDTDRATRSASFNASSLTTFAEAETVYAAAGAADRIERAVTPGMAHAFDNEVAVRFLHRVLPVTRDDGE